MLKPMYVYVMYLGGDGGRQLLQNWRNLILLGHRQRALFSAVWCTAENYINELARESPSEHAQNEWQDALNTTPSCHHRRNSGT